MIITIQIDTQKDSSEDIQKMLALINKEKPAIKFEDLPDTGADIIESKPKRKTKEKVETVESPPVVTEGIPPPPPLPGKSPFTQMMLKITPYVTEGLLLPEKIEEFCTSIGSVVNGKGVVGQLQELPHLIPKFLSLVEDHVKSKT